MYQEFLVATKQVAAMLGKKSFMFARQFNRQNFLNTEKAFLPPKNLVAADLCMVFEDVVARLKPAEVLGEGTIVDIVSIEDKINHIREILSQKVNFVFSHLTSGGASRTEVIVGFLAILELMKQREVIIEQVDMFGEITVARL